MAEQGKMEQLFLMRDSRTRKLRSQSHPQEETLRGPSRGSTPRRDARRGQAGGHEERGAGGRRQPCDAMGHSEESGLQARGRGSHRHISGRNEPRFTQEDTGSEGSGGAPTLKMAPCQESSLTFC